MTDDSHVDGNALGALFFDLFGREMTDQRGCCAACGAVNQLGCLKVYRAPGDVARCPSCDTVVMVVVSSPTGVRVSFKALRWLELA